MVAEQAANQKCNLLTFHIIIFPVRQDRVEKLRGYSGISISFAAKH